MLNITQLTKTFVFVVLLSISALPQIVQSFGIRYQTNDKGTVYIIGNTLMTCPAGACSGVNNDYNMRYVDIDGDASTFNSSTANYTIPTGGSVLWAGLYWNGVPTSAAKEQVKFKAPGSNSYTSLTGTVINSSYGYQGFKDVTALVQSAGSGNYTVANVQSGTGTNKWAGWALVVVTRDPSLPMRNLTVFEGLALVSGNNSNVAIPISGFTTPLAGPVNVELGVVAYDGDNTYTGDAFKLNNTIIKDAINGSDDFFNSSISRFGTRISAKNPDYANQLGLDCDVIKANGILANGATSATIHLSTGGESYLPGVVTSAIDLFAPDLSTTKTVVDLNGGSVVPGDILEYTISTVNNGQDGATNVVIRDSIRDFQSFLPNSISVLTGANTGSKTDASGDDQAEFAGGIVTVRLGTGASSSAVGTIAPGVSSSFKFKVVVTEPVADLAAVENRATVAYKNQTAPTRDFTGESSLTSKSVSSVADLSLTKIVSNNTPQLNTNVTYTITAHNAGPNIASGVTVNEMLPAGLIYVSSTPSQGSYSNISGLWNIGTIPVNSSVTLQVTAQVTGVSAISNKAEIKSSNQSDPNSTPDNNQPGENDQASVTVTPITTADLSMHKVVSPLNPNVGDTLTYIVKVKNAGPANATGVVAKDSLPSGLTFVSSSVTQGLYNVTNGNWTVGAVANGDSATLQVKAIVVSAGFITNIAGITGSDQPDNSGSDRFDSVTVPQKIADVSVSKNVSNSNPTPGQNVTYSIKVHNAGPNSATGVVVNDKLPSGLSFVSAVPSQGIYTASDGNWQVGTIHAADSASLSLVATVNSSSQIFNKALLTVMHESDPTLGDHADSVGIQAQSADLNITKTVSDSLPSDGATITYAVKVHNNGPVAATNVKVTDVLNSGFIYQSHTATVGTYDTSTGIWNIGTIPSGADKTLTISVKVNYTNFTSASFNLGPATGYNVFILNDITQPSCDTEGKMAVARDATLTGYSIGEKLPVSHGTVDAIVCGRNLTYNGGSIKGGNAVYGNLSNLPSYAVTMFDGNVRKDSVINFAAAKTYLRNLSTSLSTQSVTGSVSSDWGKLTLNGADPFYNVFQINGVDLNNTHTVEIYVPNGSVALVNISGTGMKWSGGLSVNGTSINNVLYNFYEADSIHLHGMDIRGTLLAPRATVYFPAGAINGQFIANNMTGSGQFNKSDFVGNIPMSQYIDNNAEITSADQNDPDSTPGNGVASEDDMANCAIHLQTNSGSSPSAANWQLVGTFANNEIILCVANDKNNNMLTGTLGGKIYRTLDGGVTWTRINNDMTNACIWSILKTKNGHLFASTETGVFKSNDNGNSWNKCSTYPTYDTRALVSDSSDNIYAAAWGFGIYKSNDDGATWGLSPVANKAVKNGDKTIAMNGFTSLAITSLAVSKENELYAGNLGDGLLKSTDGGATWTNCYLGYNFVWSVGTADDGEVLAGTYGDGLYYSMDRGGAWYKSTGIPNGSFIYSITVDSLNNKYVGSWLNGVYYLPGSSLTMKPLGLDGFKVSNVAVNKQLNLIYAGTADGKIYKYVPEGATGINNQKSDIPKDYQLYQNYPNPFNPTTKIKFALPYASLVTVKVYDLLGREIKTLLNETKQPGNYEVNFDASRLASGVYFYSIKANNFNSVKKMVFIK